MKALDLSIVIVHFNTPDLLVACVNSVIEQTKTISYEIIIVDNASHKGKKTLASLEKKSRVKVIRSKTNLGFAAGNNEGMRIAKGKYILLLNSDTVITSQSLDDIVGWMRSHKKVGIATVALRNKDLSLQSTGGFFPTLKNIFSWMFFLDDIPFLVAKPYHLRPGTKLREIEWITGAFFLIRKKALNQIGMLDPDYFMYVEDMDLCYRARLAGWRIFYNPSHSIIHLGGASSTKEFPLISEFRGILLFYKKHKPAWQYYVARLLFKLGSLARIGILGILKGPNTAKIYAKAFQAI